MELFSIRIQRTFQLVSTPINIALCIISSVMQRGIAFVWIVGIHGGIRKIRKTVNVLIAV